MKMKIRCRICKIQQGEFFTLDSTVPINGQGEHRLLDIYNKCLHLNAILEDALPQVVCLLCFEQLKEFFEFQLKATNTDLEFRGNISEIFGQERQKVFLDDYIVPGLNTPNSENDINDEIESIAKEDNLEDEENFEMDEINHNNDEEQVEDTDILFELYSKNDSCMEKYFKFANDESEEINAAEAIRDDEEIEVNKGENKMIDIKQNPYDELELTSETELSSIEIARLDFSNTLIQTVMLEPLVEIRKWECSDCGRKYLTEEKLEEHSKLHNQSENCECEICGSHLQSLYDYGLHMKTHGTERKFSCEFCDKTFSTRANLKAHLYIHSNIRPFKCEICGKAFQQKSILKTHMTLHTGKPFECTLCHRRFSRTAHLNIHMRQHNNVRPYQCPQCPSSYMQKSHLDRHIASSHLGVRFQCTVCNKMYTKKPSLNAHMREEHCATVSLYNCEVCDLDFSKQKGLYYHLKSKHPDYKKTKF